MAATPIFLSLYRRKSPEYWWRQLGFAFATRRSPPDPLFKTVSIEICGADFLSINDFFFGKEFAKFDFSFNKVGAWLRFVGPDPTRCSEQLLIPWAQVRFLRHRASVSVFVLSSKPRIGMTIPRSVGESMEKYTFRRPPRS